jgi:hypothetical protein
MPKNEEYAPRTSSSRYHNLPDEIVRFARQLQPGTFEELTGQLEPDEVLLGSFDNRQLAHVVTHLDSRERLAQIHEEVLREPDGSYAPIKYLAANKTRANEGIDPNIP